MGPPMRKPGWYCDSSRLLERLAVESTLRFTLNQVFVFIQSARR